jgi:hypothetical protein
MISRRALFAGSVGAGLGAVPVAAGAVGGDDAKLEAILSEVRALSTAMALPGQAAVAQVREARRVHLKNTGRFPEFLDVGVAIWEGTIDWLMALQQPVSTERNPEGRYTTAFLGTNLILRSDYPEIYVGQGYDR